MTCKAHPFFLLLFGDHRSLEATKVQMLILLSSSIGTLKRALMYLFYKVYIKIILAKMLELIFYFLFLSYSFDNNDVSCFNHLLK